MQSKLFREEFKGYFVNDIIRIKEPVTEYEKGLELQIVKFYRNDNQIGAKNIKVKQSFYVLDINNIEKV